MKPKARTMDGVLLALTLTSTLVFIGRNIEKPWYVLKQLIVASHQLSDESDVVRIELADGARTYRTSLVRTAVQTQDGTPVMFVHVPADIQVAQASLIINDQPATVPMGDNTVLHAVGIIHFIQHDFTHEVVRTIKTRNYIVGDATDLDSTDLDATDLGATDLDSTELDFPTQPLQ